MTTHTHGPSERRLKLNLKPNGARAREGEAVPAVFCYYYFIRLGSRASVFEAVAVLIAGVRSRGATHTQSCAAYRVASLKMLPATKMIAFIITFSVLFRSPSRSPSAVRLIRAAVVFNAVSSLVNE